MCQHLDKCKFHKQTNRHLALYAFVWLCMYMYDYIWLCMPIAYVWLCLTMFDYVWLCMTMYDYVSLFHTESISQHLHHFKPIKNVWKKISYFPWREPFPKTGQKYLKGVNSIQQGSFTFAKQKGTLAFTFIPQLQKKTQTRRMPWEKFLWKLRIMRKTSLKIFLS